MRELSRQNPMLRIGQTLITQLVAAGEIALQINANAVSVNRLKEKGAPIDWVAPGPLPGLMTIVRKICLSRSCVKDYSSSEILDKRRRLRRGCWDHP